MRLIDADELGTFGSINKGNFNSVETIQKWVDSAETVKAIPVEWLKKHKYSNIVDLWERECRLNDTKCILEELLSEHNFKSYNDYVEYAGKITALPQDARLDILFRDKDNETD